MSLASSALACGGKVVVSSDGAKPDGATVPVAAAVVCLSTPTRFASALPEDPAGGVVVIRDFVSEVAASESGVFWSVLTILPDSIDRSYDGRLMWAPLSGGAPVMLTSEIGEGYPTDLTLQGDRILWIERRVGDGRVMSARVDGSDLRALTDFEPMGQVAFDETSVYVTQGRTIQRVDARTGLSATILTTQKAYYWSVAVDSASVYTFMWPDTEDPMTLLRVAKVGGGLPVTLADLGVQGVMPIEELAADAANVYWSFNPHSGAPATLFSLAKDANASKPSVLAVTTGSARSLRLDGDNLYFSRDASGDDSRGLFRMARGGGSVNELVTLDPVTNKSDRGYGGSNGVDGFAIGRASIYWGGYDEAGNSAVFCIAK